MTKYISQEDAITALMNMTMYDDDGYILDDDEVKRECFESWLDDIPAADVREVVRCKDCRHRDPEDHKCDSGERERQGCPFKVADDYFCAYGER